MAIEKKPSGARLTLSDVERAMPGRFEPPAPSGFYLMGLFFVTALTALLPLIYLGIALGFAGLGLYIGAKGLTWLSGLRASALFGASMIYVGSIVACGIVVYYLAKQLFIKNSQLHFGDMKELDPVKEPLIFALVKSVADKTNTPAPDKIYLTMEANAMAGRTYKYIFFTDKRFLVIGLPFIEGLSVRALAGVIAHELGHHAQNLGSSLNYSLDSVVSWFGRAAYPEESWYEKIDDIAGGENGSFYGYRAYTRFFSKVGIFITIQISKLLFKMGVLLSRFFLRRREFDADAYAVAIQGSASFCEFETKSALMSVVQSYLFDNLSTFERSGQLPENIPATIVALTEDMDQAAKKGIEKYVKNVKKSLMATHPTTKERTEAATKKNSMGIYVLEAPASALLSDSYAKGKELTLDLYKRIPSVKLDTQKLATTDEIIGRKKKVSQELDNLDAFLGATIHFKNWFFPPPLSLVPPDNPKDVLEGWKSARNKMLELQKDAEEFAAAYDEIAKQRRGALIAYKLITLGIPIKDPRKYGLAEATESAAAAALNKFAARKSKTDELLAPYFKAAGARIWCVLTLLSLPAARDRMPKGEEFYENSRKLMETLLTIKSVYELLLRLEAEGDEYSILSGVADPANSNSVKEARAEKLAAMRSLVGALKSSLSAAKYPFGKEASESNIWDWATRSNRAFASDETALLNAASDCLSNLPRLYSRAMGRLCVIAAQAESLFLGGHK